MIDAKPIENEELETIQSTIIGNGQNNNYWLLKVRMVKQPEYLINFAELIGYLVNRFR
jgi:hypothetical protein